MKTSIGVKTGIRFWLALALVFVTAHRTPAPISEIATPTPTVAPKPKSKQNNVERTKPKQSPFAPFVGVWTGTVNHRGVTDIAGGVDVSDSSSTTLRISSDGMIQIQVTGQAVQGAQRANVSSNGRALTWTDQYSDSNGTGRGDGSLRLVGPNSAIYQFNAVITLSVGGKMIMKQSGTLTKQ